MENVRLAADRCESSNPVATGSPATAQPSSLTRSANSSTHPVTQAFKPRVDNESGPHDAFHRAGSRQDVIPGFSGYSDRGRGGHVVGLAV